MQVDGKESGSVVYDALDVFLCQREVVAQHSQEGALLAGHLVHVLREEGALSRKCELCDGNVNVPTECHKCISEFRLNTRSAVTWKVGRRVRKSIARETSWD